MRVRPVAAALGLAALLFVSVRHQWPTVLNANESIRYFFIVSTLEAGRLDIDPALAFYRSRNIDRAEKDGHAYLDKAPGASVLGMPFYLVWTRLLHRGPVPPPLPIDRLLQGLALFCCAVPSLLAAWALAGLARARGLSDRAAAGMAAALLIATPLALYATLYFGHAPAAAALAGSFILIDRDRPRMILAGLLGGTAVALEYPTAPLLLVLGLFALARRGPRAALSFSLGALPIAIGLALYHTAAFGSPLRTGYAYKANPEFATLHGKGLLGFGAPSLHALYGITFGRERGLFFLAPWLLLAVPGCVALYRRSRSTGLVVAGVCVGALLLGASFADWPAGHAVGPRHLVAAVPFFAYAALFAPELFAGRLRDGVVAVGAGLGAASLLQVWLPFATLPYHAPEVTDPLYTVSAPLLLSGALAPGPLDALPSPVAAALPPLVFLVGIAALVRLGRRRTLLAAAVALAWLTIAIATSPGTSRIAEAERQRARAMMRGE